jgi:hypothetical protein
VIDSGRDRLVDLLAEVGARMAFSAGRTAPTADLHLDVRGVGPIELPVPRAQAKQLCRIGRPARYGRGELTLLDPRVRDTWEIPKSRVRLDKRRFDQTLRPVLDGLGRDLGLAPKRALRAQLHSMLVYAPGQFFAEHQDSEKDDAMIGSLVVSLPSSFTGGALEVRHRGKTATYRGSKRSLSFVVFYSDCRHEVKPVRSGYRVVLTYNLLLADGQAASGSPPDPELVGGLAGCLGEHFAAAGGSDRLVFLLNHAYTRRGLDWSRLKGSDAQRVKLLGAAAERAGCELGLALAVVHETWSANEQDADWGGWSRHDRWDEDWDDDEVDTREGAGDGEYDLQELIDSEVSLNLLIESGGRRLERVSLHVEPSEVCAVTPSGELEPHDSEYEGYMGNYGNTLERWYHRGAVVLWPRDRGFAILAEASPPLALDELVARVRNGDLADARQAAATVAPFWDRVAREVEAKGFFTKALRTAQVIDDPDAAAMLLAPFRLELLAATHATALSALVGHYGEVWAGELVTGWSANRRFHREGVSTEAWIASLPRLCTALGETGVPGAAAATLLLHQAWSWLSQSLERNAELSPPSRREQTLSELGRPVAAILEAASLLDAGDLREDAVQVLCRDDEVARCAVEVLRTIPASRWQATGLLAVVNHRATALQARLARPPRASDDWSINLAGGCECELCDELRGFLADPTTRRFEWPLAKDRRAHVHSRIDSAELPVHHQTRRAGRPYTLVLAKTDALFEREQQKRRRDELELAWLQADSGHMG